MLPNGLVGRSACVSTVRVVGRVVGFTQYSCQCVGRGATASASRSPSAYLLNPADERAAYDGDVDTDFTLLRVDDAATGDL